MPNVLSHIGIWPKDINASLKWYTEVLGLQEAFRLHRDDGEIHLVYLHLGENAFVELLNPAQPKNPGGVHFAIQVEDIEQAVADLKKRLPAESLRNPDIKIGSCGAKLFNFFDPDGNRIEFMEFGSGSLQAEALAKLRARSE